MHINDDGLLQANKCAVAVGRDPGFEAVDVSWEIWIIGDIIMLEAKNQLDEDGYLGIHAEVREHADSCGHLGADHRKRQTQDEVRTARAGDRTIEGRRDRVPARVP
ncbi:hypothetical protein NQ166_08795 [Microbacterium sp. zg.Y1090]|uniref:hypothetical protein n=1 Tax=Microbacterium wangruii TaxID=3049073 RepID=UPI00214D23F0|nr:MULTISPECIES: hypothetical protein [unclassified Microbacterium]MCR2818923.1 hypothetical protein [Microbacterium sp. zg.Y1090]WIM27230.1 hypothetical protein QNO26_08605 [Microbacterium sp. zg-Y1090]